MVLDMIGGVTETGRAGVKLAINSEVSKVVAM